MYKAYITELKNVRPHPNADRLQLGDCFGNTVCVNLDYTEGQLGIYFPTDGQLSIEFAEYNNLLRKKDEAGNNIGGYMDPNKRNVCAIKLRGEKSDGLFLPLSSLEYTGANLSTLRAGDVIDGTLNGHHICQKYIPAVKVVEYNKQKYGSKIPKIKINLTPYFAEHIDTPQLRFCQDMFKPGDYICLTEKVHGTSSRNANTLTVSYKRSLFDKIFHRKGKEIHEYKYVVGTRRTTVNESSGGFYGSNQFRLDWGERFKGKLNPGEEVYGEIAGFTGPNAPIMSRGDNKKTKDKQFIKTYGPTTIFSYGCDEEKGENRFFIYRMTYTTPEGMVIEYPWDLVKFRAEQMGFEVVPELERFIYTTQEDFMARIEKYMDIPSTIDPRHIIEGVVVRALNAPNKFVVAKEKSFNFKVLESIIKVDAEVPDIEEAEELVEL